MELVVKRFEELTVQELYDLLQARVAVFVVEQDCPFQEIDGKDRLAYHVFYRENNQIQAYVRVIEPNESCDLVSIGRVLSLARGQGLGKKIMLEGIRVAEEKLGARVIYIEAQTYAKGFYEQLGFRQSSEEFLEDGIPHIKMLLTL
jgi:Predicted acyltransferase